MCIRDSARAVLVQPEECPHEVLGRAGGDGVEVLAVYPQRLGHLVQPVSYTHLSAYLWAIY